MADATAAGYDAIAEAYARHIAGELAHKPFDREFLVRVATQAPPGPALDLGCGPGHIARFIADQGRDVTGIDLSPAMVAQARSANPLQRFDVADLRALPFADGTFAVLVAFYSIIHLAPAELTTTFAEMRRVMAPGAWLALSFHVGDEVRHVDELWGVKTQLDFRFLQPPHIETLLRDAGLRVVESLVRAPYAPEVEAQTQRAYLIATA